MSLSISPLRYPGGKYVLYKYLSEIIIKNGLSDGIYIEAFAGGAAAALKLLTDEYVNEIILNDIDESIYAFWDSILNNTDSFIKLIEKCPLTLNEWKRQRAILNSTTELSLIEKGFAFFYMNRCNRSGIWNAGPIGGTAQLGEWKIDARFNKKELIRRIELISFYRKRIKLYNLDCIKFLKKITKTYSCRLDDILVYLDPPYYIMGKELYRNYFVQADHSELSQYINRQNGFRWIISYDDVPEIHQLYKGNRRNIFYLNYAINRSKVGRELIISSHNCSLPKSASFDKSFNNSKRVSNFGKLKEIFAL